MLCHVWSGQSQHALLAALCYDALCNLIWGCDMLSAGMFRSAMEYHGMLDVPCYGVLCAVMLGYGMHYFALAPEMACYARI
eukprot:4631541-Pyramimonas_sp.AAC.1